MPHHIPRRSPCPPRPIRPRPIRPRPCQPSPRPCCPPFINAICQRLEAFPHVSIPAVAVDVERSHLGAWCAADEECLVNGARNVIGCRLR